MPSDDTRPAPGLLRHLPAAVGVASVGLAAAVAWLVQDGHAHDAHRSWEPWLVFVLGSLAGGLLARQLAQQARERSLAQRQVDHLHADVERLALVARTTSNAVIITDARRRITWVNAGFERITGYSAAEAQGRSPGRLLQCEATDPVTVHLLRTALNAGQPFVGELLNRGKNGQTYWIEFDIQPVRNAEGGLTGFIAIESDISDRKQVEVALRASRAFLHNIGRIAGVGGWSYDLRQRKLNWTDQACAILEVSTDHQPTLQECLAGCPPEAHGLLQQAIDQGISPDRGWDLELPFDTVAGHRRWLRVVAEPEFDDLGAARLVGAVQDVTARREMQTEVQRQSQLLRGAIDTIDEAFVLYDAEDRLVFCNDKYRDIYQASRAAIVPGATFESILRHGLAHGQYPAAAGREETWLAERLAQHRSGTATLTQRLDDGRVLRILERTTPDGHRVGFRIDITDLVRATEAAEMANNAKSEFIGTISHELRTPLQSVIGFSELGQHFAQDQPRFERMFTDILSGGRRMLTLVNALLDMSKLDGSGATLAMAREDLAALTADVLRELRPLIDARALRLQVPDPLPVLPVRVNAFRMQQVIRNVLANAIRFAPQGSALQISAREGASGGTLLTVRDHGPGIPPDELETIFEAFVQSSRTRDGSGGTGLGLTICRKIMRAHGGRIEAANADGGGAEMRLWLPPLHAEPAPVALARAAPADAGDAPLLSTPA